MVRIQTESHLPISMYYVNFVWSGMIFKQCFLTESAVDREKPLKNLPQTDASCCTQKNCRVESCRPTIHNHVQLPEFEKNDHAMHIRSKKSVVFARLLRSLTTSSLRLFLLLLSLQIATRTMTDAFQQYIKIRTFLGYRPKEILLELQNAFGKQEKEKMLGE